MQEHCEGRSGVVRRLLSAGALTVVLGGLVPAGVQAQSLTQSDNSAQASPSLSAFRAYLSANSAAQGVARRERTTMIVGAAITSTDIEGLPSDDRLSRIAALVPRVAIGRDINSRFAIEVPLSLQSEKEEGDDRFTEIDLGVRPVITAFGSDAVSGVITLLGRVNRQSYGDESTNRFGWEIGAGPEFVINEALSFRGTFVFGSLAEDDDLGIPKESYYGLNLDLVHNLSAPGPIRSGGFTIRSGAAFTSFSPDGADGVTAIEIPSPYLGLYFGLGEQSRFRLGSEIEIERQSLGDNSARDITLIPTLEYDFGPADRLGFRVRALGLITNVAFDNGSNDESGTITGFGGGGAVVFPMFQRYRGMFGLDYLKSQENEDLGVPSTNVIRGSFGIELNF